MTYFAGDTPPDGWLVCDGSAVSREDYFELFAVIGTKYGEGDGSTTFNLPNETDSRFREGSATAGTKRNAGLPNITGVMKNTGEHGMVDDPKQQQGAFIAKTKMGHNLGAGQSPGYALNFDASLSNPIYGASDTVQPKSITYVPIIRAF